MISTTSIRGLAVAGIVLGAVPSIAHAQLLRGIVSDGTTETPVELADVRAIDASGDVIGTALTNADGFFEMALEDDTDFIVRVTALGYRSYREGPLVLEEDEMRIVYPRMEPAALSIEGLTVEAGLTDSRLRERGFYERMEEGKGQFLTPADIAASDALFTPDLFIGMDHVMPNYGVAPWRRGVRLMHAFEQGNCSPRVFIDGVWMNGYRWPPGESLDDLVPMDDILGVELYWGVFEAPMQYSGTVKDNSCGVVLFWTNR